jgi:membrane associated rhomboid family serine protease
VSAPAETLVCYRHPRTETAVTCSDCERPICPECMVFGPVGIRCPECAGRPTGVRKATAGLRAAAGESGSATVTKVLVGMNVGVFLLQLTQAGLTDDFGLYGPFVAEGEWWRLLTSAFLHGSPIHLLFNMLMLWWFGGPLESMLGRGRFVGLYLVSALAGSAGALLLSPRALTVGASGAVFGILGAGLVLERRRVYVFGGGALAVVLFNLVFSFLVPNVSIGGHLGGLAGGVLAMLALSRFGRGHAVYGRVGLVGVAGLVGVGLVSVVIAYARVRGLA